MNSRRVLILIVAIIVGGVAAFGVTQYVQSVEDNNAADSAIEQAWVVQRPIEKATTFEVALQQGLIAEADIPAEFRPSTAITDPQVELAGLVAVTDLPMNSVLVAGNFVSPSVVATGITDRLEEEGMVSITISTDPTRAAGGMIEPGDYVNLILNTPVDEGADEDGAGATGEDGAVPQAPAADGELPEGQDRSEESPFSYDPRYLYQAAYVLAVGDQLVPDLGESADGEEAPAGNTSLLTLAVPPEAAQMILAIGPEDIYFSLIPSNYVPGVLPPVDFDIRVLPGEDEAQLTPYATEDEDDAVE